MKDEGGAEERAGHDGVIREEMEDLGGRTKRFSLRVIRLFAALPTSIPAQVIGKQVLRSATSVGANYREARRARSDPEFVAKIGDCLKELDETHYWMELLAESEIIAPSRIAALQVEADELLAIFTSISKSLKSRSLYK